jgi:hypothetical protein
MLITIQRAVIANTLVYKEIVSDFYFSIIGNCNRLFTGLKKINNFGHMFVYFFYYNITNITLSLAIDLYALFSYYIILISRK